MTAPLELTVTEFNMESVKFILLQEGNKYTG